MGLFDFAMNMGKKLFSSDNEAASAVKKHIEEDNPGVDNLEVEFKDNKVVITGDAASADAVEKAVLMAGNVKGVAGVDTSAVNVPKQEANVEMYEIKSGDSLWKIAAKFLGNGARYPEIFEMNREVIKDPDLIYPGQIIRIVVDK